MILLYHRIASTAREIDVPSKLFAWHLTGLRNSGLAASLHDALSPTTRGGVVVSFDDGSSDFYRTALPLLREYQVPAVLYLVTGDIANRPTDSQLGWDHVRQAVESGLVTIGAHTHTHCNLARATPRVAEEEIRTSKQEIEDHLGIPCRHFAYPWAVGSAAADMIVRQLFDSAALYAWRTNRRAKFDPFRLGRTPVMRSDDGLFFKAKLEGRLNAEGLFYRVGRRGPWGQL